MTFSGDLEVMKRILVCEANTFVGQRICERFDKTSEWYVTATRRPAVSPDCLKGDLDDIAGVHQWIPSYAADSVEFKKFVLEADVIVCPLTDNTEEAFAAIRMLSNTSYDTEKTFVLVSSVMTWADTVLAEKTIAAAERKAERDAAIAAGEEVPEEEEEVPAEPEEPPTFTEDQYQRRVPHRRYDHWKELEHFTKHVNSETLHTYVLFSGIPYGCGEDLLHRYFRAAWHAQPLPLLTDGTNRVPLIHVKDLASAVFRVGTATEVLAQRYIFAVDKGNHTYGQIVGVINERLGSGQTQVIPPARHHTVRLVEQVTVDLKVEPAAIYDIVDEEEWVSPEGFIAGIDKVVSEYLQWRSVTPVRLVLLGPPQSGKSTIAAQVAKEYKLPHLRVPQVIEEYREYLSELKHSVRRRRTERKEAKRLAALEEARRAAEEAAAEAAAAADGGERREEEADGAEDDPPRLQSTIAASDDGQNASIVDEFQVEFSTDAPPEAAGGAEAVQGEEEEDKAPAEVDLDAEADPAVEDDEKDDPEDEEDEILVALKEKIAAAEKTLQTTVAPISASPPTDEDGNPIEPPAETSPRRPMLGKPYGEVERAPTQTQQSPPGVNSVPDDKGEAPRLRPAALATVVRWRVSQRDCRAQGYVLDGYPKSVRDAAMLYAAGDIPLPDAQEPEPTGDDDSASLLSAVDDKLLPEFVAFLEGSEELFCRRAAGNGVDALARYYRRRKDYLANHSASTAPHKSLISWFRAILTNREGAPRETSVRLLDVSDANESATLASCREWIGSPHYYRPTPAEIHREAQQRQLDDERTTIERLKAEEEALRVAASESAAKRQEKAKHERRYTSIQHEQAEAAAIQSMPMQTYLMQFVVPALTKGIAHCVSLRPEDPVDSLADYLFNFTAKRAL